MSAQPSTAQPTTAAISLATLRSVLAELKAQEPERGCRWDRAATIVALRTIKPGYADGHWVESECEAHRWYWVLRVPSGNWTCYCQDFQQRGGPCKHALAVRLLHACEDREAAREPIAFPARAYSDEDRFELTPQGLAALEQPEPDPEPDPDGAPMRGPRLGDGSYWGECRTCGDIGVVAANGRGLCCTG